MASSLEKRIASVIIVLVLACQFFAVVAQSNKWGWPFTDYPMYAWPHHEGERVVAYHRVFATTADGEEVEISGSDVGLNIWQFMQWTRQQVASNMSASDAAQLPQPNLPSLHSLIRSTGFAAWLEGADAPPPDTIHRDVDQVSPAMTGIIVSRYEQKYGKRVVRLRIEDNGVIVTKQGMQEVPREVVAEIAVDRERE